MNDIDSMNMFTRRNDTYDYDEGLLQNILNDEANPLTRIIQSIPENSRVLDIGAGNGLLATLFQFDGKEIIIDGIEPSEYATNIARHKYRTFYNGFVQHYMEEILHEKYDYIVFADVIEHIDNPVDIFKDFFERLDLSTKIIISIPNIAFGSVRLSLMYGKFDYVNSGILESTHLRFYTLETLKKMLSNFNLNIEKISYLLRNFNTTEINLNNLKCNPLMVNFISKDKLSHVYQFLVILSKVDVKLTEEEFGYKSKFPALEYMLKPFVQKNIKLKQFVKRFYK